MTTTYAGYIGANDGFNGPVAFDGPAGWTVDKMQQTEIFKVHHGLGLPNPHRLRIVVTTQKPMTIANVESMTANDFVISVWTTSGAPAMTDLGFVAVKA